MCIRLALFMSMMKISINMSNIRSTDQMLDQQIECQINRWKVRTTDQKLVQSDQKLDQQIKSQINISKVKSKYPKLYQQMKVRKKNQNFY